MRRLLRNLSLKRKLTAISMLACGVALVLTCAAFIVYDQITLRGDMIRELETTARIVGANSASSLSFDDDASAAVTLKTLEAQPHIVGACIYDPEGNVFAFYRRDSVGNRHLASDHSELLNRPWPASRPDHIAFTDDALELFHTIRFSDEAIGTIYLRSDLHELGERLLHYIEISTLILVAALLSAWLLTNRLQHVVSGPIGQLVATAEKVARQRDYTLRATKDANDEVGALVDGFNHMLAEIEKSDAELKAAHRDLEKRVEERTASLEQARREATLEKERFKFIFDFLPVGVSLHTPNEHDQGLRLYNEAHLRICGLSRSELGDRDVFQRITHPDDYARQLEFKDRMDRGEITEYSLEKRYLRPDGGITWVVFSCQRKDYADGRSEFLYTIVDVTDLKRAQEETVKERARFKFIFDSLPVGVAWMMKGRPDTRIVNPALARITGVPLEQSQDIQKYRDVTHPDDQGAQAELEGRLARDEIDHYELEKRYRRADGEWTWGVLSVRLLKSEHGDEVQEIGTLIDITDRKRAEIELESTHRQLLDASRQAGMAEVATGVLHNVGNVLNSVNVSATLVSDLVRRSKAPNLGKLRDLIEQHRADLGRYLTEDAKGRMIPAYLGTLADSLANEHKTIVAELESLHKNIGHIKDIVSMQQSYAKTSGVVETLSVPDLVEDALRMNAGSLARHDVDVIREYDGRPVVTVEKNKVLQILVNFIRNAKYACDESGRIDKKITLRTHADATGVSISVADNGVGIPPDNLTRIFAHGFTTRKHGHGFGLHSGALAARELGGSLTVHSDGIGKGSVFTLKLPFSQETKRP